MLGKLDLLKKGVREIGRKKIEEEEEKKVTEELREDPYRLVPPIVLVDTEEIENELPPDEQTLSLPFSRDLSLFDVVDYASEAFDYQFGCEVGILRRERNVGEICFVDLHICGFCL